MDLIRLSTPQKVLDALKQGEKIAVFSLDEQNLPQSKLSDVIFGVSPKSESGAGLLEPAIRYLRHNYVKDVKLNRLAELCEISPCYFSRLFSRYTGTNLADYVNNLRLRHACRQLRSSEKSVVSIACEAGFVDCGYFYKLFRKKYGCTPLEYRKGGIDTAK